MALYQARLKQDVSVEYAREILQAMLKNEMPAVRQTFLNDDGNFASGTEINYDRLTGKVTCFLDELRTQGIKPRYRKAA